MSEDSRVVIAVAGGVAAIAAVIAVLEPAWVVAVLALAVITVTVAAARARIEVVAPTALVAWRGRWAPELILLPVAVSVRWHWMLAAAALGVVLLVALMRESDLTASRPSFPRLVPMVLLLGAYLLTTRPGADSVLTTLAAMCGVVAVVLVSSFKTRTADAQMSLLRGVGLYLLVNVVGWLAGLKSPHANERVGGLDSSFSLFGERVFFPFSSSLAEPPAVAAAFLVALVAVWFVQRRIRPVELVTGSAAALVLVASNSRVPLAVGLLVTLLVLVSTRALMRAAAPTMVLGMAFPFFFASTLPALNNAATWLSNHDFIARGQGAEKLAGVSDRGGLWEVATAYWGSGMRASSMLFGYGAHGQVASGIYTQYPPDLKNVAASAESLTLHSSLLQQLYDGGAVGVLLMVTALLVAMRGLRRCGPAGLPSMMLLVVLGLAASTESFLAPGVGGTPLLIVMALCAFTVADRARGDERLDDATLPAARGGVPIALTVQRKPSTPSTPSPEEKGASFDLVNAGTNE